MRIFFDVLTRNMVDITIEEVTLDKLYKMGLLRPEASTVVENLRSLYSDLLSRLRSFLSRYVLVNDIERITVGVLTIGVKFRDGVVLKISNMDNSFSMEVGRYVRKIYAEISKLSSFVNPDFTVEACGIVYRLDKLFLRDQWTDIPIEDGPYCEARLRLVPQSEPQLPTSRVVAEVLSEMEGELRKMFENMGIRVEGRICPEITSPTYLLLSEREGSVLFSHIVIETGRGKVYLNIRNGLPREFMQKILEILSKYKNKLKQAIEEENNLLTEVRKELESKLRELLCQ